MIVKLKDAFNLQMGKTPSRADLSLWGGNNKWISIADIGSAKKHISSTKECITDEGVSRSGIKVVPEGTVIMSFKLSIGKTAIVSEDMYTNEAIMAFIDNGTYCIDPNYLYHLCCGTDWTQGGNKAVMGLTLNKATLSEMEIELPTLEEQREIASILDQLDAIIEKRHDELNMIEQLVKSRFIELFGDGNDERFPLKTLPQIVAKDRHTLKRGPFGGALKKDDFVESGYLVYEQRHAIHNDFEYEKYYISPKKYQEMSMFKVSPGDLIISCSGVTLGRIAEIPVYAKAGIINQALLKVSLDQSIMRNTFFVHQFRSERIQDILFGFCRGSGIPNFPSMSEVKSVKFICPPIALQEQFAAFVEQTDKSKLCGEMEVAA